MDSELLYVIKKALEYYDIMTEKFNKNFKNPGTFHSVKREIILDDEHFNYEFLGVFDTNSSVWIWAYAIPTMPNNLKKESEELHLYGLKQNIHLDPVENNEFNVEFTNLDSNISLLNFYKKTILCNSRILINNDLEIDIILAISSYLLKDRIKYIYKSEEESGLVNYYLLK